MLALNKIIEGLKNNCPFSIKEKIIILIYLSKLH